MRLSRREQRRCANLLTVSQGKLDQWELFWDLLSDAEYQRAVVGLRAGLQLCLSAYRDSVPTHHGRTANPVREILHERGG